MGSPTCRAAHLRVRRRYRIRLARGRGPARRPSFPPTANGPDLDSPDHKSHLAYPVNQACPSTHPVHVPKLRQVLRYPVNGDPSRFRLASGPGYTIHGDLFTPGRSRRWPGASRTASARPPPHWSATAAARPAIDHQDQRAGDAQTA
ncbi:DUF1996 domain-containing protein [Micromonospora sp. ALFpr18c]|uniref:DUF1996 domain-containing protein n=1 Tax=Micromonospora sp. ALFpr18c TaxID=1458665 RepID=UPI001CED4AAE